MTSLAHQYEEDMGTGRSSIIDRGGTGTDSKSGSPTMTKDEYLKQKTINQERKNHRKFLRMVDVMG